MLTNYFKKLAERRDQRNLWEKKYDSLFDSIRSLPTLDDDKLIDQMRLAAEGVVVMSTSFVFKRKAHVAASSIVQAGIMAVEGRIKADGEDHHVALAQFFSALEGTPIRDVPLAKAIIRASDQMKISETAGPKPSQP